MATLGRNMVFPIKNADGTPFHNLVLRKATVDSVVMSLGDKIIGDVYYQDNTLQCTMQEYVEYNNVKYTIVNPPTIVREGLVKDNSDLNGMTKYSFEFYHPMYILGNLPFSDVAVSFDEERYLSQNKTFSWIGKPQDYINKINKNLEGTEWIVVKSSRFPQEKDDVLSDVLSFDNNTIADALKTGYETWGLPYVVSQINIGETYYSQGKRFKVEFGLPSNEILVDNEPYIFQFGQGVGLKNNSRTPRNNKIITRIAGYGSENNIPYGYPQIRWYGDQSATQTPAGYPIYDGIVGGVVRKLIKHPFTRTHLMPSIYTQTVFNKVSPYLANGSDNPDYNPNAEIIDYYDAISSEEYPYINEINLLAPSYEIHEFADVKPELDSDRQLGIVSAIPLNQDLTPASQWDDTYDAEKDEYVQSYFKITLPQLSFDLYACASIMEEMQVNMRSGACIGCTFPIQVDWDDYKRNFYDADGNFLPDGSQRDLTKYPKSNLGQIDIIVKKETQTFGTLMPNIYQQPTANDLFVILGISMPIEYITNAEERLDDAMKSYMLENNVYYYDYPLKFDEYFLATETNILSQIRPNSIIRFGFEGYPVPLELFVKQITVKYGNDVLPQYDITLTDNIEIVLNQIGQVADDVEKLSSLVAILRQTYNRNIWSELDKKLSRTNNDTAQGKITFRQGADFADNAQGQFTPDVVGAGIWKDENKNWNIEGDYLHARKKLTAKEVQTDKVTPKTEGEPVKVDGNLDVDGNATVEGTATINGKTTIGTSATQTAQTDVLDVKGTSKVRTVVFGDFVPGMISGAEQGARIDESGAAQFRSVSISEFLEVPEIRFNRATVYVGIGLRSVGGGIIEEVIAEQSGGVTLASGRAALKLEDGEYGAVDLYDLCLGFWHNEGTPGTGVDNETTDYDPHNGDYTLKGFQSIYFRIDGFYANETDFRNGTNVIQDTTTPRGSNKYFHYVLRGNSYADFVPSAQRRSWIRHPQAQLHFGQIGNTNNTDRQSLLVTTPRYDLRLEHLTNWNYNSDNIISIEGDLEGFSMTSTYGGQTYTKEFHGNGTVFGNAYIYGKLDQFERVAYRCFIDQSLGGSLAYGETETETVTVLNGYGEDVTSEFTRFTVTRDSGDAVSDAAWNAQHTSVNNPFSIAWGDLGIDGIHRLSTQFYLTATDEVTGETTQATLDFFS